MKVEIELSDLALQMFGKNPAPKIKQVVEDEAIRLWHIERSRPKEHSPKLPGRPPLDAKEQRFRELVKLLEGIYQKRREFLGTDFDAVLGESYGKLQQAINDRDLDALVQLEHDKPWQRRWAT